MSSIRSDVSIQYWLVMNRQSDRQTETHAKASSVVQVKTCANYFDWFFLPLDQVQEGRTSKVQAANTCSHE